jgi:hypothetical protein
LVGRYRQALRAPFERASLRTFEVELRAALLFAGCAWGAWPFFLGGTDNLLFILTFSTGMVAAAEMATRGAAAARYFAAPAAMIPAAALALGPPGAGAGLVVLLGGLLVIAAAEAANRLFSPRVPAILATS